MHDSRDLEQQLADSFGNNDPREAGFEARTVAGTQLRLWRKRRQRVAVFAGVGAVAATVLLWASLDGRFGQNQPDVSAKAETSPERFAPRPASVPQPAAPSVPSSHADQNALLIVETQPISTVYVDGVVRGDSTQPLEIASGEHEVRVEYAGSVSKTWQVELKSNQWLRLKHTFAIVPNVVELASAEEKQVAVPAIPGAMQTTLVETPTYQVKASYSAHIAKDTTETIRIEITPKPGWGIGTKLPLRLDVESTSGVALFRPLTTGEDAATFSEHLTIVDVDFNSSESGNKAFAGELTFGLCTKATCQTISAKLAWSVTIEKQPKQGGLKLSSTPTGARVSMDGRYVGRTPLRMAQLPQGAHHLRISKDGFLPHQVTAHIRPNDIAAIRVKLEEYDENEFPWLDKEPPPTSGLPVRLGRKDISDGIAEIRGRVTSCGRHLSVLPATAKAKIKIGGDGQVHSATTSAGTAKFQVCMKAAIKAATFPETQKGANISYPFVFQ